MINRDLSQLCVLRVLSEMPLKRGAVGRLGIPEGSVCMKKRHWARWAGACTLAVVLSELAGFAAADATPYDRMAPLAQYLVPPGSEIALARSAAPAAISMLEVSVS
jgi:hypothetical protein